MLVLAIGEESAVLLRVVTVVKCTQRYATVFTGIFRCIWKMSLVVAVAGASP